MVYSTCRCYLHLLCYLVFYLQVMGCLFRNGRRKYSDNFYDNVRMIRMTDAEHYLNIH